MILMYQNHSKYIFQFSIVPIRACYSRNSKWFLNFKKIILIYKRSVQINYAAPEYWDGVFGLNGLAAFNIEINYDDFKIYCYPKEALMDHSRVSDE